MPYAIPRYADTALADAANVGPLRRACAAFARDHGFSESRADDVELAVAEALNNVVTHAYRYAAQPGAMTVIATCVENAILVTVADQGAGYSIRGDSPGAGMGMFLIRELADSVEVTGNPEAGGRGMMMKMCFAPGGALM